MKLGELVEKLNDMIESGEMDESVPVVVDHYPHMLEITDIQTGVEAGEDYVALVVDTEV